jgi:hypothetical protein
VKPSSGNGVGSKNPWWTDPERSMNWSFSFEIYNDIMTYDECARVAKAKGFNWFGLEFSQECWISRSPPRYGVLSADRCKMPCTGDKKQTCGGYLAMDTYSLTGDCGSNVTASFCGCFADRYTNDIRKPVQGGNTPSNNPWYHDPARWGIWPFEFPIYNKEMTIEKCSATAASLGYKFYGLEFGQE